MNQSVIIQIKAGEVPARDFIELALRNCPSCFGLAVQDGEGDDATLDILSGTTNVSVDKLMDTLEAVKDSPVVLTLGNMTQDFNESEDLMPFVFQQASSGGEDPEDILAVFMEGDASKYSRVGEGHTEIANMWEDLVFPTISEKFEASADLPAFYDKLRKSAFQQTILNCFGHRGVAVFVPLIGEPIAYGDNDLGAEYPWGNVSNTFGYGEKKAEPIKTVVQKTKSRLQSLMSSAAPAKETTTTTTTVDANGIHHTKPKDAPKQVISDTNTGDTMMKPPTKLQGNARNAWIRLFTNNPNGALDANSKDKDYAVPVAADLIPYALRDISTKDQVKNLGKEVANAKKKLDLGAAHEQIQDPKVTEKGPEVVNNDKKKVGDYLPDLSADDKKGSTDLVTDWATRPEGKTPNALEILRIESKWPAFTTTAGIKSTDMLAWSISDLKELGKKHSDALALAFLEMKSIAIANGAFSDYLKSIDKKPETKAEKVETKTADVPASTAPKKLSRLERMKAA